MSWESDNAGWLARTARWAPRKVEPLRLRVWLSSPLAWDGATAITIEGPLQFAVVCRETGRLPDDVFNGAPREGSIPIAIPIEDVMIGGRQIACASWGIAPPIAVESVRWRRKRARAEHLGLAKVQANGGIYKSLNIPVGSLVAPWLDFYVRGDRDLLTDLCRDVQGLGRDSTRGMGTVLGVEITGDPDDRSLLYKGAPQRAIPLMLDGGDYDPRCLEPDTWDERETTTRAPYWKQSSLAVCAVPAVSMGATIQDAVPIEEDEPEEDHPADRIGATGQFFVTPHAVRRFVEGFAPRMTFEQALAELIQLTSGARLIGPYVGEKIRDSVPGAELWRTLRQRTPGGGQLATSRMRFVVGHGEPGTLAQIVTVLPRSGS